VNAVNTKAASLKDGKTLFIGASRFIQSAQIMKIACAIFDTPPAC
jgi:hypothetical protein